MKKPIPVIVLALLYRNLLTAQEATPPDTLKILKEVVVTYQAGKRTPVTFLNISARELDVKYTGQEPSFLLTETPSVTNYSDAGNTQGYSYFRLRGIDQTRINTTLDGVPLNEPEDQGAYFSNYPDLFNSVSRVQVQRGVGTSKNGVASYGGSIQLFSPNLYDSGRTTVGAGYGSFNSGRAYVEYNSGLKGHSALYARASEVYAEGYKYHSANHAQSAFISGGLFYPRSTWKANLLVGHQQNQLAWLGVADSLIKKDKRTNADTDEKDRFVQGLVQLQNSWRPNAFSSLQSSVYSIFLQGNYDFDLNNFLGLPSTAEMYNYAFKSGLAGFFSNYTLSKKSLNWTAGIHGNTYARRHTGSERTAGELYKNTGYKKEISVFTKAEYTLRRLTLFADIQGRYTRFDYQGSVAINRLAWRFFNPKAGVSLQAGQHAVFYYSIGRSGREPTRNDLFGGNDDLLTDSVGRPLFYNKTPEQVTDHELGLRYQAPRLDFDINGYYMNFRNEIVLDGKFGPNGLALTDKVEQSFRMGFELSARYRLGAHLALVNNSSFNYSRIREQKTRFTPILTPPLIINQELIYSATRFSAALSARYQDRSWIDFANTAHVKSYLILNGRIGYEASRLQLGLFVNNVTNRTYFNNGYVDFNGTRKYFVQAPVNFYASVKYSF